MSESTLQIAVGQEIFSWEQGAIEMKRSLLPPVCVRCGAAGGAEELLKSRTALPKAFWFSVAGFFLAPLLFGLGTLLVTSEEALTNYRQWGVWILVGASSWCGLMTARMAALRPPWRLTFTLCERCQPPYRQLRRWASLATRCAGLSLLLFFLYCTFGALALASSSLGSWIFLALVASLCLTSLTALVFHLRSCVHRRLTASLRLNPMVLRLRFSNPDVASKMREVIRP